MKLGFIGLGRMGKNMVYNLKDKGHSVIANNRSPKPVNEVKRKGIQTAYSIEELVRKLPKQKIIWLMVKSGKPVDLLISQLLPHLKKGDIIIDGGNSYFKDSIKRHNQLKKKNIHFLDCGTSGGMEGARRGACMMVGGNKAAFKKTERLFKDMCVKDGYGYMGNSGAGHFVKMVHNGIEYGMMSAIAEGMAAVRNSSKHFKTDIKTAAKVYAHGSIIESRLMSWFLTALNSKEFKSISGEVPKGETEDEMKHLEGISKMPILHQSRLMRIQSRKKPSFEGKAIAAMRNQFGGHAVKKK
ncbi:MAG: decarboxylating 6-phosphogluconate dehydrogenase [Candidatus Woesearchaeota archaeon]|nr:decarboxylating 6-phosphogluconate dehydrogenase [Candidatus Woesearchaeota archaeon]